ncbi:uncharacterized protein LOC112046188 [Bicyclus anynana]|uniref:Uncharacterized protein LOC112046188 n=1 Tax=Bicyclus anynana TaxID=110368 RepID=A0A6J1MSA2_BICAN|nr:uncharacterized protein LOC112046188 [Bicyclus anynana]
MTRDYSNIYNLEVATSYLSNMFSSKSLVSIFVLCLVHESLSKPYSSSVEGRGVGSTLWGWISYPFTWWSSDVNEIPFETGPGVGTNPFDGSNSVEIESYNVSLWCTDQTCTTIKCNRLGCKNITCNLYDTDMTGECRHYNTKVKPEEPTTPRSTETSLKPQPEDQKSENSSQPTVVPNTVISSTENYNTQVTEDRPLELEAVLSSTVTENVEKEVA